MDMNVAVPASLLGDIFRLLDYLGDLSDRDDSRFRKTRSSHRLEHDNALWELKFKIKQFQHQIVETYLQTTGGVAEDEMDALEEWVARGGSVYDNPDYICDDSGRPMDFTNAHRVDVEMSEDPPSFFDVEPDDVCSDCCEGDLPW